MDRTVKSPVLQHLLQACPVPGLAACLAGVERDFGEHAGDFPALAEKYEVFGKPSLDLDEKLQALIRAAVELASAEAPHWDKIAARLRYLDFARHLAESEAKRGITNFVAKLRYLTAKELYGSYILENYTEQELRVASRFIVAERNHLYSYAGLDLLLSRYVIHTHHGVALESPQEMYLGIALHLAMLEEPSVRMDWVRRFYDMLSLQQVTMATPTLANARKPYHQLSSCFIDTVPDSLDGIYRSLDSFAKVSKWGGGMGLYFGKVRATGAAIRGFEGAAGGVIRWIRLVNDTAVAVDQLGVRQGACAVYLDAWHKDLPEFLQLRTNNGDDRMKAHDIFPAVCYPDLFWKLAKEDLDAPWFLMDPHEIEMVMGYALEDFWGEEWEKRYRACVAEPRIDKRVISVKEIVRLILKSVVETGTPFAFYRDTVVQVTTRPGDFVVCNLASLNLGRIDVTSQEELRSVVRTAVRALDNVIDLNEAPLAYARLTNGKYRSIGLGVSGYHHMLAKNAVRWESEEHLVFVDDVFSRINYAAIEASSDLAAEKGSYGCFAGSDWQTGAYFKKRGYESEAWRELAAKVRAQGMRNAYLLAVAPTSSTSILVGTTAGVDPIMKHFFLEEKKGAILPRIAPDLSMKTFWYYKSAHTVDQNWSVRAAGVRQRHIDQAQSVNLYITNDFTFRQVLALYIKAYEEGVKTIYYVRSKSLEVEECESCSS